MSKAAVPHQFLTPSASITPLCILQIQLAAPYIPVEKRSQPLDQKFKTSSKSVFVVRMAAAR